MQRVVALAVLFVGFLVARRAEAYPQFQLVTGTDTCHMCHFSPGGGGLLNDYGRDEASDISMWQKGDGRFLHGLWTPPDSFQIGGDVRLASGFEDKSATGTEGPFAFPMQTELYLRPKVGAISLYVAAGLRDSRGVVKPTSREHYVMYEKDGGSWYVRAGRFFPIYGIRSQDHTSFIRRDLQMYLYEEPYGAAWGKYTASSELHVSAFVKAFGPLQQLGTAEDNGVAVYYEKRNADSTAAYAAQTKLTVSDTDRRAWVGGIYKKYLDGPKVLLLGETDGAIQMFPSSGGTTPGPLFEGIAYAQATWFAKQGLMIGGGLQAFDPDLAHHGTSRTAAEVNVQWFPIPHLEAHLLTRYEAVDLDPNQGMLLVLAQLHYYI